jgi:hypothetical protein
MKFRARTMLKKMADLLGTKVTCEDCTEKIDAGGWMRIGDVAGGMVKFRLMTKNGSSLNVVVLGLQKPFSIGTENASGRFVYLESQARKIIQAAVGDAKSDENADDEDRAEDNRASLP